MVVSYQLLSFLISFGVWRTTCIQILRESRLNNTVKFPSIILICYFKGYIKGRQIYLGGGWGGC